MSRDHAAEAADDNDTSLGAELFARMARRCGGDTVRLLAMLDSLAIACIGLATHHLPADKRALGRTALATVIGSCLSQRVEELNRKEMH